MRAEYITPELWRGCWRRRGGRKEEGRRSHRLSGVRVRVRVVVAIEGLESSCRGEGEGEIGGYWRGRAVEESGVRVRVRVRVRARIRVQAELGQVVCTRACSPQSFIL